MMVVIIMTMFMLNQLFLLHEALQQIWFICWSVLNVLPTVRSFQYMRPKLCRATSCLDQLARKRKRRSLALKFPVSNKIWCSEDGAVECLIEA